MMMNDDFDKWLAERDKDSSPSGGGVALRPGQRIGAYKVVRLLGAGGMGAVYEVEHIELGTHYALKTFTYDTKDKYAGILLNKFREEAKMLSRINHPCVSRAFDLTHDVVRGILYYVMDLVLYKDGESYSLDEVDRESLSEDLVYGWFCDACEALDHIHSLGIVHRDVKLENFLIDADKHAVLADFGISRIFGEEMKKEVSPYKTMRIKRSNVTEKVVLGTEHYIAPEVRAGREATPAVDVYALGIMIFKLFIDKWADGMSIAQVDAWLHGYKYRWYKVVPKLLEFDPSRRPTHLVDLIPLLDRQTVPSPRPKPKPSKKGRGIAGVNVLRTVVKIVFAGILCGGGYFFYRGWKQYCAQERDRAERLAAMQRQIDERAKTSDKVFTNTVERVVERFVVHIVETNIVNQTPAEPTVDEDDVLTPAAMPQQDKPKEEVVIVKSDDDDSKDYGPIPDKKYDWFKGGKMKLPQEVKFQLANGAEIELVPMNPGDLIVKSEWYRAEPSYRKITITRPFWVSKYLVTAEAFREYDETEVADCIPIEQAVGATYPVSKNLTRAQTEGFCRFLTKKYKKQLPEGYVFRLPSIGEWQHAISAEENSRKNGNWWDKILCHGGGSKITMEELRRKRHLDRICQWKTQSDYGWDASGMIFVGGRNQPLVTGVFDPCATHQQMVLDMVSPEHWPESSVDPLFCDVEIFNRDGYCSSLVAEWEAIKAYGIDRRERRVNHIVLGPDLVKERAWENKKTEFVQAKIDNMPHQSVRLNPDIVPANKLSRANEVSLAMVSKQKMVFCTIPKVDRFYMSNPDGQEKQRHEIKLTYPFWISKYCVTVDQLREFGRYEGEQYALLEVEKRLQTMSKRPLICPSRCRTKWMAYCRFLSERYASFLPKGYVFRLPTEAEYEWATVANANGDIRNLKRNLYSSDDEDVVKSLEKLWKKLKMPEDVKFESRGCINGFYLGGRTKANAFGVCDMIIDSWGYQNLVLDMYDCSWYNINDGKREGNVNKPEEYMCYADKEVDPFHSAGRLATRMVRRSGAGRGLVNKNDWTGCAHIVIGPDFEKKVEESELAPYPREKFGGILLDKVARVSAISSKATDANFNTEENWRRLLSDESVADRQNTWWDGCRTEPEDEPWIEIELDRIRQIMGIQIDVFRNRHWAGHPRVLVSEDRKRWIEVFKDDRELGRYLADFSRRNVKGRYIRIMREKKYRSDRFVLSKVLIYDKER